MGKLIIISAPSGTGKSTIIATLMRQAPELRLSFSISATSRSPREGEQDGREYYFLSPAEFRSRIEGNLFLEWEEVYQDKYYGTLRSEVERIFSDGGNVIFDIDCVGALNIKRAYGADALTIFITPPSLTELERRLRGRATDSEAVIAERLAKAQQEMSFAPQFDVVLVNDDLEQCVQAVTESIRTHLGTGHL